MCSDILKISILVAATTFGAEAFVPSIISSATHDVTSYSTATKSTKTQRWMAPGGGQEDVVAPLMTRSQDIISTLAYPLGFVAAFRTGAALSVINQPRIPPVEQPVGSRVLRLPSGTRVRLFYPTTAAATGSSEEDAMAPYCTAGRQTSDGMAGLVGFRQLGLSFLLAHLASASSGCIQDAPIATATDDGTTLPLLIYSHGYGGNMDMGAYFLRTMASKGMIVAALEHTDGTASSTVRRDGSELRFNSYLMTGRQQLTRRAQEMLEAADFLPTELEHVGKIFFGGHGANAESNIAGIILHDPALGMGYGMLPPNGSDNKLPTISYVSDEYNRANVRYGALTLHVKGCYHGNFVDAPLWAPMWVMRPLSLAIPAAGPADPMMVHDQLAESAAAFMLTRNPQSPDVMMGNLFEFVR